MIALSGYNFLTTLVLVFKKIKCDDKTQYDTYYLHSKTEIIIIDSEKKVKAGLLIQS